MQFKKGYDPRRHILTTEERRKGYRNAVAKKGIRFVRWLRGQVAATATPANVQAFKTRFMQQRKAQ